MDLTKRILALALALVMLLPLAACGAATDDPAETGNQSTNANTEADTDFFPDVEKTDYQGEVFRMLGEAYTGIWYYAEDYFNNEEKQHILNDTIYEMNTMVEDHLGVEIQYETVVITRGGEIFDKAAPTILSGDDEYQLCILHPYYSYTNFITKNYVLDFYDLPDFDVEKPYWNKDVMERLSINDHAYIGLGDLCQYTINMIYCNKNLLQEAKLDVPYEQVRNGEWTLDTFFSMTSGLYADDGDGKRNNMDTYGFASLWDANASAFMQSCDIYVVTRNEADMFELSLYGDRLEDMYAKLYNWSKDESTYLWRFADRANTNVVIDFLDGRTYFNLDTLGTRYLEAEFQLGMLPLPKYDTKQESYAHVNWGNNVLLPNTIKNKEMVGQVLELMGYYSKTLVQQKYYDDVLQLRVSEAPDDRDMVELIYSTVVYDPGIAFCDGNGQLWNLVYLPCFAILEKNESIAAYYKRNSRSAQRGLDLIFTKAQS